MNKLTKALLLLICVGMLSSCLKTGLDPSITGIQEASEASNEGGGEEEIITEPPPIALPPTSFISIWKTTGAGESITLPLRTGFSYNFDVDWGDGNTSVITSDTDIDKTHYYDLAGTYTVTIDGLVQAWYFNGSVDSDKILSIPDLGDVGWINLHAAFAGCSNLTTISGGNTSQVTDMSYMFDGAVNAQPDTEFWDTGNVTSMYAMFVSANSATPHTTNWDVSSVINFAYAFSNNSSVNPDTSNWDVSSAQNFTYMYSNNPIGNPDTSNWVTTSATTMFGMFYNATSAMPDVSKFDTSNVTNMGNMFKFATSIETLDLSNFDTFNVTNMSNMFYSASSLTNLNTTNWNISNVSSSSNIFALKNAGLTVYCDQGGGPGTGTLFTESCN